MDSPKFLRGLSGDQSVQGCLSRGPVTISWGCLFWAHTSFPRSSMTRFSLRLYFHTAQAAYCWRTFIERIRELYPKHLRTKYILVHPYNSSISRFTGTNDYVETIWNLGGCCRPWIRLIGWQKWDGTTSRLREICNWTWSKKDWTLKRKHGEEHSSSMTTMNPRSIAVIETAAAPPKRCGINDESMRLLTGAQLTKDVLQYIS